MNAATGESRIPGNIVFMAIPDRFAVEIGSFRVDPAIPIPVETGTGVGDLASLGWEMIVAGMLRVLAYDGGNANAEYYREFILAVKPDIVAELSGAGIAKAQSADYDVAEEVFKALVSLVPGQPEPLLDLAILYEDRADAYERMGSETLAEAMRDKAFGAYRSLLSFEPPFPDAFFNAGFFYLKSRTYDRALELFSAYAELGTDEAKLAKAREIVVRLRMSSQADSLLKEAYDYIRMGREEEGEAKAREFLETNPDVWNAWFLIGWSLRRRDRYDSGRDAFLRAIGLGADDADTLNELAICEMELGLLKESRASLERALRIEPENVKIISNLGVLALRAGRQAEAAAFFRTVLELEPEDPLAREQVKALGGA